VTRLPVLSNVLTLVFCRPHPTVLPDDRLYLISPAFLNGWPFPHHVALLAERPIATGYHPSWVRYGPDSFARLPRFPSARSAVCTCWPPPWLPDLLVAAEGNRRQQHSPRKARELGTLHATLDQPFAF